MSPITREIIPNIFGRPSIFGIEIVQFRKARCARAFNEMPLLQNTSLSDGGDGPPRPGTPEPVAGYDDSSGNNLARQDAVFDENTTSVQLQSEMTESAMADGTASDDGPLSEREVVGVVEVSDGQVGRKSDRSRRLMKVAGKIKRMLKRSVSRKQQ